MSKEKLDDQITSLSPQAAVLLEGWAKPLRRHDTSRKHSEVNGKSKIDTSKPSAAPVAAGGRRYTVSLALPGSIISNVQRLELKTNLAGQIGRALAVFCVNEVIIYNDGTVPTEDSGGISEPNTFLAHILQFLETPQYLRTYLFPMHPDLRHAALLKSMDITHHLKADDRLPYREGVTIPFPSSKREKGTLVDVGYCQAVLPNDDIEPYTRVTLDMTRVKEPAEVEYIRNTTLASPTDPTTKLGYYWGYATRQADSLSKVITESPYENGYDFVIGTSERGESLTPDLLVALPEFSHLLVVFGGQAGIEAAAENDSELPLGSENISDLFDWWVNCVPGQGSRTIRTEEAVWIALSQIYSAVQRQGIK